jgi:ABC-type transport system substrate-binding protein
LAKIGIKTNLKPLDPAVYTATGAPDRPTFSGVRLSAGAFAGLYEAASEFALSRTMGYASNAMGFYDDRFTALVKTASTEPDAAKRKALYAQINDFLLEDAAYCFPICAYVNLMVARANVRGLRHEPSTQVTLRNMWLA